MNHDSKDGNLLQAKNAKKRNGEMAATGLQRGTADVGGVAVAAGLAVGAV